MSGTLVGVISDTHSVRTKPEVNLSGLGASHDPEGGVKTCFLFNFAPEMGYLLCVIDRYHSDVTVLGLKTEYQPVSAFVNCKGQIQIAYFMLQYMKTLTYQLDIATINQ